jgi:predicted ATPase
LRHAGVLVVHPESATCELSSGQRFSTLRDVHLPQSLKTLITKRIDRLGSTEQLVLKIAAIFGREFPRAGVSAVFASEGGSCNNLDTSLKSLTEQGIVEIVSHTAHVSHDAASVADDDDEKESGALPALGTSTDETSAATTTPSNDSWYRFTHALMQRACCDVMLFSKRAQLHLRVARWFERSAAEMGLVTDILELRQHLAHHYAAAVLLALASSSSSTSSAALVLDIASASASASASSVPSTSSASSAASAAHADRDSFVQAANKAVLYGLDIARVYAQRGVEREQHRCATDALRVLEQCAEISPDREKWARLGDELRALANEGARA